MRGTRESFLNHKLQGFVHRLRWSAGSEQDVDDGGGGGSGGYCCPGAGG
jgi:hypothetical protein